MDRAERMGMRPVIKEARPAVQLACPYQLVKTAPSLAMRSTLVVGWPRVAPPPEYAPKSFHPVSSVMSITMLGLLFWATLETEPPTSKRFEKTSAISASFRIPVSVFMPVSEGYPKRRLKMRLEFQCDNQL